MWRFIVPRPFVFMKNEGQPHQSLFFQDLKTELTKSSYGFLKMVYRFLIFAQNNVNVIKK